MPVIVGEQVQRWSGRHASGVCVTGFLFSTSGVFLRFARSEQFGSALMLLCAVVSLVIANSEIGPEWLGLWQREAFGLSFEHWVNDGLMAVFFLLIGLELERAVIAGELSELRRASLPVVAAVGGMLVPALIHGGLNGGLPTARGFAIPMATDIAFALGAVAILRDRVPASLRVFIVAFAVIDDLGAIVVIALFYTRDISLVPLAGALALWTLMLGMRRWLRVRLLLPYLAGGILLWLLMLKSGVHATLAGVALAFVIPYSTDGQGDSPSHRLEHRLSGPVSFLILPLFALVNAAVPVEFGIHDLVGDANAGGIALGLLVGKPLGIVLFSRVAVSLNWSRLPQGVGWRHLLGAGLLGGIGFTMSIFIANLAFGSFSDQANQSKVAIFAASGLSAVAGCLWLRFGAKRPSIPPTSSAEA